jgi:hypothetical protein
MRKPAPTPTSSGKKAPTEPEPPAGRAMQRARQFAMQRGLPVPSAEAAAKKAAVAGKPPARKKLP